MLLSETGGAETPQPLHSPGLCGREWVMVPLWIMTLSQAKKVEFSKYAAGGGLREAFLLPLLISSLGTH